MSGNLHQQAFRDAERDCGGKFKDDFETILGSGNGYVISAPDVFCLARGVFISMNSDGEPIRTDDGAIFGQHTILMSIFEFLPEHQNCLHIHSLAGSVEKLFTYLPLRLPYVSWEEGGRLIVQSYDELKNNHNAGN